MSLFRTLPGNAMRVSDVMTALARDDTDSTVRASQMNLVLHFGPQVAPEEGYALWETAVHFSHRHPCRIIALCPEESDAPMEGKLHVGCFIEDGQKERRCCEALALQYPAQNGNRILENQLSVWLESDLPTYHWFHGMSAETIAREWRTLVHDSHRVLYDSSVCSGDFSQVLGIKPGVTRDLATARILPVRQALGQFFSAYSPKVLVAGLRRVEIRYSERRRGEAQGLYAWMEAGVKECARVAEVPLTAEFSKTHAEDENVCLVLDCAYDNDDQFHWEHAARSNDARIEVRMGGTVRTYPLRVAFLDPVQTLSEALFGG